jgi:rRNA processing protein Gar1
MSLEEDDYHNYHHQEEEEDVGFVNDVFGRMSRSYLLH